MIGRESVEKKDSAMATGNGISSSALSEPTVVRTLGGGKCQSGFPEGIFSPPGFVFR
jgi:hypothetical protein